MTVKELISKYESRNSQLDKMTDHINHQLHLLNKEKPNKVNMSQKKDMEITNKRLTQEWALNTQFIKELKSL